MPEKEKQVLSLGGIAEKLGAEVYADQQGYQCVLPADVNQSIAARGRTAAEAVDNWEIKLKAHLRNASASDPVVSYVKKAFATGQVTAQASGGNPWSVERLRGYKQPNVQGSAKI
ncbi:hypothetical protein [Pedobacter aquatilis]|uniref:hypothetical protein n=1 Tax=Pedobacter aquatilis TaxID=351343 RepID=UPI00292DA6D6|nr:hypothetical protein [Pedobacter aquatilis]